MPAQVFGFTDRGEIARRRIRRHRDLRSGESQDKATYQDPHQIAEGMSWVIVNGQVARRELEFTGARGGRALRR